MANVELIPTEQAPLLARPYYGDGEPSPLIAAWAHVPEFLATAMPFISAVSGPSSLPERLKELVVLRASVRNRCRYCVQTHTVVAWDCGLTDGEVSALREEGEMPATFDARERAVIDFTDALCDRPAEAVAHLRPHFTDHEVVELVTVGAETIMLNRFATALALPASTENVRRLREKGIRY